MWRTPRICGGNALSCGANCGTRRMSNILRRTPCAAPNAGHRTLPPSRKRGGRKAEAQKDRGSGRNEDPHRDLGCGGGPVTGLSGSEDRSDRGGCHQAISSRGPLGAHTIERPSPKFPVHRRFAGGGAGPGTQPACRTHRGTRAAWCSYHRATLTTPIDCRLAGGRPGPDKKDDPHRDSGCGVGPVTGSAGSDGWCGRGGRHRFRLKAEGLLMLIPSRGPHPFLAPPCRTARPRASRRASRSRLFTCLKPR